MNEPLQDIKKILKNVKQMTLSTSNQNKPWATTLIFAYDQELYLYFFSAQDTRHSQHIRNNKFIAGTIASEHTKGLAEPFHQGIQFEGTCLLVTPKEVTSAYKCYKQRHPLISEFHDKKDATKELYKIKVNKFVLFDTRKRKMRQELTWLN